MTNNRETRCKKKKDRKILEVIELLNDEDRKKEVNKEVTKKKILKIRIVFV